VPTATIDDEVVRDLLVGSGNKIEVTDGGGLNQ